MPMDVCADVVPLARGCPRGGLGKAAACSVSQAIQGSVLQPGLPAWPRSQLGSSPLTAEGTAEKASASACGSLPRSLLVALCLKHPAETLPWLPGACRGFCRVCSAATKRLEGSHPPGRHPGTTAPGSSPSPPAICEWDQSRTALALAQDIFKLKPEATQQLPHHALAAVHAAVPLLLPLRSPARLEGPSNLSHSMLCAQHHTNYQPGSLTPIGTSPAEFSPPSFGFSANIPRACPLLAPGGTVTRSAQTPPPRQQGTPRGTLLAQYLVWFCLLVSLSPLLPLPRNLCAHLMSWAVVQGSPAALFVSCAWFQGCPAAFFSPQIRTLGAVVSCRVRAG